MAAAFAALVAFATVCGAQQTAGPRDDPRPGDDFVDQWAGSYDIDAFFAVPRIRSELEALLGDELGPLFHNLDVKGDIDMVRGALSVAGNAPHGGTEEEAVVCVLPGTQEVHAAMLSAGQITIYTRAAGYDALPLCIKDWITLVSAGYVDRFEQPDNVKVLQR